MNKIIWTIATALIAFLFSFLGYTLTHAELPSPELPIQLYATETLHDLQTTFVQAIDDSQSSIHLIIYSLRDKKVINALKRAAERGVQVEIICDRNASSGLAKRFNKNVSVTYRGGKGLMHQKILVCDQSLILCGSANLTTASLKMHGNLVVGIYAPELARGILTKFNAMKKTGLVAHVPGFKTTVDKQHLEFWFFPDQTQGVEILKRLLRSAQKTIKIAMFTWTRNDLADAVIAAKRRGVQVEVVLDRNAASGVSQHIVEKLLSGGINVRVNTGDELLHHKLLLIDGRTLVNGSANWTKAAFTSNDDFFLILFPLTPPQTRSLDSMWEEIALHSRSVDEI